MTETRIDDEPAIARFRCLDCSRALRVPEAVIGKRIVCPYCRSKFDTAFVIDVTPETPPAPQPEPVPTAEASTSSLTRWIPNKGSIVSAANRAANVVRSGADRGLQTAQSAASQVGSSITNAAKRAAVAVAPMTQGVTAVASAILPGSGELMSGKMAQGGCTLAAFLGATAASAVVVGAGAAVLATPAGAAIVAAPVAIRVFSAWQGARGGRDLGTHIQTRVLNSGALSLEEAERIADEARRQAESMSEAEFERMLIETEEEELRIVELTPHRRVCLTKVT